MSRLINSNTIYPGLFSQVPSEWWCASSLVCLLTEAVSGFHDFPMVRSVSDPGAETLTDLVMSPCVEGGVEERTSELCKLGLDATCKYAIYTTCGRTRQNSDDGWIVSRSGDAAKAKSWDGYDTRADAKRQEQKRTTALDSSQPVARGPTSSPIDQKHRNNQHRPSSTPPHTHMNPRNMQNTKHADYI